MKDKAWSITHPALCAVNTVGSGATVCWRPFIGRLDQGAEIEEALRWAAAAGEATAISAGLADYRQILKLKDNVNVSRMIARVDYEKLQWQELTTGRRTEL